MNSQQLQRAIDSARDFLNIPSSPGGILHGARENTKIHLKRLEEIQAIRAGTMGPAKKTLDDIQ